MDNHPPVKKGSLLYGSDAAGAIRASGAGAHPGAAAPRGTDPAPLETVAPTSLSLTTPATLTPRVRPRRGVPRLKTPDSRRSRKGEDVKRRPGLFYGYWRDPLTGQRLQRVRGRSSRRPTDFGRSTPISAWAEGGPRERDGRREGAPLPGRSAGADPPLRRGRRPPRGRGPGRLPHLQRRPRR